MSTRHRLRPRHARRAASALLVALLAGSLGLVSSAAAQPPPTVSTLTADAARRAGRAVSGINVTLGDQRIVAVTPPRRQDSARSGGPDDPGTAEWQRREAMRLLDVSGDGTLAIADALDDPGSGVALVAPSGDQRVISLPGVAGAAFAPSADWLAVVDAGGHLWRVDSGTGAASRVADGPFSGSIRFARDGWLLLISLPSAEAPFTAAPVRVDPESGRVRAVDGAATLGLVLAAAQLADGTLAVVTHAPGEGVSFLHLTSGIAVPAATLGPDAIDVSISEDGSAVAYAEAGGDVYLVSPGSTTPTPLGRGALPRLSADGRLVAILRDGQTAIVDVNGREVQRMAAASAAWAHPALGCGGCAS